MAKGKKKTTLWVVLAAVILAIFALGKLGAEIASYHATEIDKFAIQTTQANFPDVVQLGDAFQVREDGWTYAGLTGGASEAAE